MFGWRRRPESDFSAELQAHLELEVDRLRAEGLSEAEARHLARKSLGNLSGAMERFYESGEWVWLEQLLQDTRYALRRLGKAPAFSCSVILTLALGIGATTSIFTLVHAILLRSLPVAKPGQLLRLGNRTHCCLWGGFRQSGEFSIVSYELYGQFRDHTPGFEELAAFQAGNLSLAVRRAHSSSAAESLVGELVSGNYFSMFGVSAYLGRVLTPDDDRIGSPAVAVMSYRLWRLRYGLDRGVLGSVFNLNGKPFTIVGITPPGFYGDTLRETAHDFYLPLSTEALVNDDDGYLLQQAGANWLDLIGRMKAGENAASIEGQMRVELQRWLRSHSGDMDANQRKEISKQTLYLTPGGAGITSMREAYEQWLHILMTVAGFVLLIACANVATLMLVRGIRQRAQTSMSLALGAKSRRLVRQALTESLVLSLFGGAAGIALAFEGTSLILRYALPANSSMPISAMPPWPVLLFALGATVVTGVAFGSAPAWVATRVDPIEALRGVNRATAKTGSLSRRALVVVQAALSLVLLSTAGLLTGALMHLEKQDFGFEQDGRMVFNIDALSAGYRADQLDVLYRRMRDAIARIPGVETVALGSYSPQSGDAWLDAIYIPGQRPEASVNNDAGIDRVTDDYFRAIGNSIVLGRPITQQDTAGSAHVAVVNEAFSKRYFKGRNPIGRRFGRNDIAVAGDFEIVGVAKDARFFTFNLDQPVGALAFLPEAQTTVFPKAAENQSEARTHFLSDVVVKLRPGGKVSEAQLQAAMATVDPNLPVVNVRSLREQVAQSFSQQRLIARITSLFGGLALVLASIGIYGVTAYNAGSRINEIGVRMALGAGRSDVLGLILRGAGSLIWVGLALGIPLSLAAGRFLGGQLYGINQYDPETIGLAVAALGFCGLVAAVIPAIRASSISPTRALRTE